MLRLRATVCTATILIAIAGCGGVSSTHPVGSPAPNDFLKKLEGTWRGNNVIYVKSLGHGKLELAGLELDDGHFALKTLKVIVGKIGDAYFVSFHDSGKGEDQPYTFLKLVVANERTVILFPPNIPAFEQAVTQKKLKGTVVNNDGRTTVHIESERSAFDEFLASNKSGQLFSIDVPLVLHRIADLP